MLVLGEIIHVAIWPEAGATITLTPLYEDEDAKLTRETTSKEYDQGRLVDIKHDYDAYAERVGLQCIKSWTGVVNEHGAEVECTPDNIKRLMKIPVARAFVMKQVKSLDIYLRKEVLDAKNA